jgi:photosystem II stability/assembly factor-like uncharacterized protein
MGSPFVVCVVNLVRSPLVVAVLLMAACSPPASVNPSPTGSKISASPSATAAATASATPTPTDPGPLVLAAIQRLNARVGYLSAAYGTGPGLAKTSDGGMTWQRAPIPADYLTSLRFIDEQVGWAVGLVNRKGMVLRTQDGGQHWETVLAIPTDVGQPIRQIQAIDGLRAWAVTQDQSPCQGLCPSDLQRTTDGGQTWTTLVHAEIAAIRFASASRGWVALANTPSPGSIEVRETSDGGMTWRASLDTNAGFVAGLDAATTSIAWLLTNDTAYCSASDCQKYNLFRTDNGGLNWSSLGNPKDFTKGCSGGNLAGPLFASTGRGWLGLALGAGGAAVGPGGILRSDDGGRTWRCATTPPNISVVSAADPLHVWAMSQHRLTQSAALYTTEDGGASWQALDLSSLR